MSSTPTPLTRLPDWPTHFAAYLARCQAMPFAWGSHDCCQFARGHLRAITGTDPARGWGLRRYKTAKGAVSQLRRLGGVAALPAKAGLEEIPLAYARRGDLVLGKVGDGGGVALGVVTGDKAAFASRLGLLHHPVLECVRAWRI